MYKMHIISGGWRKMVDEEFLTILHQPLYRIALFVYIFICYL